MRGRNCELIKNVQLRRESCVRRTDCHWQHYRAIFAQHFLGVIFSSFQCIGIAQAQVSQPILKLHYISGWGCFGMSGSNPILRTVDSLLYLISQFVVCANPEKDSAMPMMMFLVKACQLANWVNPCRHRSQLKSPTQFDGFINQTLGHHLTDLTLFYKSFLSQLPIILLTHVCFVYTEVAGLC